MTAAMVKRIVLRDRPPRGRRFTCVLTLISIALMGAARDPGPIRAEPKSLERATPGQRSWEKDRDRLFDSEPRGSRLRQRSAWTRPLI
jgi:hypothetical protein